MYQDPERAVEPQEQQPIVCPVCWAECGKLYRSWLTHEIVGCDECLEAFTPEEDE